MTPGIWRRLFEWNKGTKLLVSVSYTAVLFVLSSAPDSKGSEDPNSLVSSQTQNLLHFPAYGILAVLCSITFSAFGFSRLSNVLASFVLASGFGAFTEVYQGWVPGRFPSFSDFVVDLAGILVFLGVYQRFMASRPDRYPNATAWREQDDAPRPSLLENHADRDQSD